jgi:hypothetical protein
VNLCGRFINAVYIRKWMQARKAHILQSEVGRKTVRLGIRRLQEMMHLGVDSGFWGEDGLKVMTQLISMYETG